MGILSIARIGKNREQRERRRVLIDTKHYLTLQVDLYPNYWLTVKPLQESDFSFIVAINRSSELEDLAAALGKAIKCEQMDVYNFWTEGQVNIDGKNYGSCGPYGEGHMKVKMAEIFLSHDQQMICNATGHRYPGEWKFIITETDKANFTQPTFLPTILHSLGKLPVAPPEMEEEY